MRFELSEDQKLLRDSTQDMLARESPTAVSRQVSESDGEGFSRDHWKQLGELGYLGLVAPESAGGQGLGAIELAAVCEEMGRVCFPGPYLDVVLAAKVLEAAGEQETLAAVVSGQAIAVLATADAVWPERGEGVSFTDGRVAGTKYFVPFGASADRLLVTTPAGVVLAEGPFETAPMPTLDEAARFAEVSLDNPAVSLGEASLVDGVADLAAVGAAAKALGVCEAAMERTVEYAKTRETFGHPIGSFQALQHRMASMLVQAESSRSTVYRAAWALAAGVPEATLLAASAKAYAVEAANNISRESVQIHGGNGFTWEYDLHRYLKLAMTLEQHYGGHGEVLERALDAAAEL